MVHEEPSSSVLLSSSPRSSMLSGSVMETKAAQEHHGKDTEEPLSLDDFINLLPTFLVTCKEQQKQHQIGDVTADDDSLTRTLADPVGALLERVQLDKSDWERFAFVDPNRSYTRNLIATDHDTFTLLLLCWTPGHSSPVHDHPCDGCWLRVLQGSVREVRYANDGDSGGLVCTRDETYDRGVVFITDSQGYHKIENPSKTELAVSLHLYSPPFQKCRIWLDERRDNPCNTFMCNYSEYGIKR